MCDSRARATWHARCGCCKGRTLPLDLRTEAITPPEVALAASPRRWWTTRSGLGATAAVAALMLGAPVWVFAPVERIPVAVAPVVNQTGYAELDAYRLALTQEMVAQLTNSLRIQVLPYDRLLQIVRRFRSAGQNVSSREAIQALTVHSGAQIIIAPTLLYENGAWRTRVELRDAGTATNVATYTTDRVASSLMKDAAYGLLRPLAARIAGHFTATGPRRAYVADRIRTLVRPAPAAGLPRLRTLDAAEAFEQRVDAYEQQEYSTALRGFTAASRLDERNPLLFAWRSRAARLMRNDNEAAAAAEQAAQLTAPQTQRRDRLFIEAVLRPRVFLDT